MEAHVSHKFQHAYNRARLPSVKGHSAQSSSISSISSTSSIDSLEHEPHLEEFELDTSSALLSRPPLHQRTVSDPLSPSANAHFNQVPQKPVTIKSNGESAPRVASESTTSATKESLLAYVHSLKNASQSALALSRQPLQRTQSDTTTAIVKEGPSLYKAALAQQRHQRQLSTDSISSSHSHEGGLETVDLSHKRITSLPPEVIKVLANSIERLALGYNHLTTLPREFVQLGDSLRYLNVRVNSLTVFPSVLCDLPSLEILDISRNKIKRLPTNPGSLRRLKVFSISKNRIKRLPAYLGSMGDLRVLKIDHNPLEWPPRDIVTFPGSNSPTASQMSRTHSDRNASDLQQAKMDESRVMLKWLVTLQRYIKENPEPKLQMSAQDSETDSDAEFSPPSSRLDTLPQRDPSPSITPTATAPKPPVLPFNRKASDSEVSSMHSRKGSGAPLPRIPVEPLRTKKSLPDLKLGQTPTSATFDTQALKSPMVENGNPRFPNASPSSRDAALPHDNKMTERHSGAYFRRLSMLPANKAVPPHLLQFIDSVRGILFSLSQLHSALKQFVAFATQDRLPAALTKMLSSADGSMSDLINALDRFDSASRRRTTELGVFREVLNACRESVALFSKLAGVMKIQLKALTSQADTRYIRTLQLMLYGSLGEIGIAWKSMAPHALDIASLLAKDSTLLSDAALTLQPPTPSPKGNESIMSESTGNRTASHRRQGGSFSSRDVQIGAAIKPATPPADHSVSSSNDRSVPALAVIPTPSTARRGPPRNLPIPLSSSTSTSSGVAYMDLIATLEGLPPTPIHAHPPTNSAVATHNHMNGMRSPTEPSASGNLIMPPRRGNSFSHTAASVQPLSSRSVDNDYMELVDSTTNVAFSVCNMLLESLSHVAPSRASNQRASVLLEMCDSTNDSARRLKSSLEGARRENSVFTQRQLGDDSNLFARGVIALAKQAKEASIELQFSKPIREGLSALAKATHSLIALLQVSSFGPLQRS